MELEKVRRKVKDKAPSDTRQPREGRRMAQYILVWRIPRLREVVYEGKQELEKRFSQPIRDGLGF